MSVDILVGNCLERLRELSDDSIHCVITSPPYWGLRAYNGEAGMIGLEPTMDAHLAALVEVFREVRRVLRPDGVCWLNYGDTYAGSWGAQSRTDPGTGISQRQIKARMAARRSHAGSLERTPGLKPKDLMMMGARVALALQLPHLCCLGCGFVAHELKWGRFPNGRKICPACEKSKGNRVEVPGWWVRSEIIWNKPNAMPESVTDRPSCTHEKVFLLAKSSRYFYDAEAVKQPCQSGPSDIKKMREGKDRIGGKHKVLDDPLAKASAATEVGRKRSVGNPAARSSRNVWTIASQGYSEAHFATFPPKLVEPCIKAGTSERGCCSHCGAPWAREVIHSYEIAPSNTGKVRGTKHRNTGADSAAANRARDGHVEGLTKVGKTTGSRPSCECDAGGPELKSEGTPRRDGERWNENKGRGFIPTQAKPAGWRPACACDVATVPAIVLDPFSGAGTVGLVAQRLGRHAILIEISAVYAAQARDRIVADAPLLSEVTVIPSALRLRYKVSRRPQTPLTHSEPLTIPQEPAQGRDAPNLATPPIKD